MELTDCADFGIPSKPSLQRSSIPAFQQVSTLGAGDYADLVWTGAILSWSPRAASTFTTVATERRIAQLLTHVN